MSDKFGGGEFEDAWFGDDRLRRRAIRVCERLAEHASESIPVACCGRAEVEAAYRGSGLKPSQFPEPL